MINKNFTFYANRSIEDVLADLTTSAQGLSSAQAEQRLRVYGPNEINETIITWWEVVKNQIKNPFIFIFIAIAGIYFFTQQYTECIILIIIMMINTAIGFYQEYQSSRAMALLKSYLQATILVSRAGNDEQLPINKIVPGDIIKLNAGDIIPADCRFIATENCIVDESMLTGESIPTQKMHMLTDKIITGMHDAYTIGYTGTIIVDGNATAVVFATASATAMGSIALLATHTITKSNLAKGTTQLAEIVFGLVLISLVLVMGINVFFKTEQLSFIKFLLFAGALAITAIPSALPIVITFCLTRGAMVLHKHKMIVKRLSAIEDLGGIEVLCTDKTGTLTENLLSVKDVYSAHEQDILLYAAFTADMLSSTKKIISNGFDQAIVQGLTTEQKNLLQEYTFVKELPFTYERHRSIVLVQKNDTYVLVTKGSAEYVIPLCTSLSQQERAMVHEWVKKNEMRGDRVLAVAAQTITDMQKSDDVIAYDTKYDTLGLIAFADPLKTTAVTAVKKAQTLGVHIKVLSGDSKYVCFTIAQQLGLENNIDNVVLGTDFEKASEEQKMFLAYNRTIFARVTPEHKYQIIAYLQREHSVGYIGDGINDAPALKIAQVGIAVNTAAAVAREAAEIIMLQKSLLNVLLGIEEGRKIIINTLKYIKITISSNVGNFYSLAFSSLLINYLPMLPLQLLFLDLITDFPLIAISTDSVKKQELQKPLQYSMKDISFVTFLFGLVSSPFDFLVFGFFKSHPATLQTSWFMASALTQLALIFSLRTKQPFWRAHRPSLLLLSLCVLAAIIVMCVPFTSFGQKFFLFARPSAHDMFIIISIVIAYFITTETVKIMYYCNHM
jgi:Mg2+-importing ATPase